MAEDIDVEAMLEAPYKKEVGPVFYRHEKPEFLKLRLRAPPRTV